MGDACIRLLRRPASLDRCLEAVTLELRSVQDVQDVVCVPESGLTDYVLNKPASPSGQVKVMQYCTRPKLVSSSSSSRARHRVSTQAACRHAAASTRAASSKSDEGGNAARQPPKRDHQACVENSSGCSAQPQHDVHNSLVVHTHWPMHNTQHSSGPNPVRTPTTSLANHHMQKTATSPAISIPLRRRRRNRHPSGKMGIRVLVKQPRFHLSQRKFELRIGGTRHGAATEVEKRNYRRSTRIHGNQGFSWSPEHKPVGGGQGGNSATDSTAGNIHRLSCDYLLSQGCWNLLGHGTISREQTRKTGNA